MKIQPAAMSRTPIAVRSDIFSLKKSDESMTVNTILSLSSGATRDTSPSCIALK